MESSTQVLRRLLDECGVEWAEYGDGYTEFCTRQVVDGERHYTDVRHYTVQPNVMGSLIVAGLTPEQAIEATLGCGTCHLISAPQYGEGCQECSSCGAVLDGYLFDGGRCPNCRAKVVNG